MHNGKQNISAVAGSLCEARATVRSVGGGGDDYRKAAHRIETSFVRLQKKPGGKLDSPPGLKLGVVIPKAFGVVIKRRALMPLFLR